MFGFGKKKKEMQQAAAAPVIAPAPVERKVPVLETHVRTAAGNRQYQQDAAFITPTRVLAANKKTRVLALVCDGMGGMADGGAASELAIKMMVTGFKNIEKQPDVNIPAFFRQGIITIDKAIANLPKENGRGSGTTMVACIAEDNKVYWASVGDSRIYVIRGTREIRMDQVTTDHNYWLKLQEKVRAGEMTMEEAKNQKQKEALISYLGMGNVSLMDINTKPYEMKKGDVIMLCSDGITKTLTDDKIKKIFLAEQVPPEQKAEALVEAATHTNSHSQDNTTVALIHYTDQDIKKISSRR